MSDLDDKILKALEADAQRIEKELANSDGLFDMIGGVLKGSMRGWVIVLFFMSFIIFGIFIWCMYMSIMAETTYDQVFWGIWAILAMFGVNNIKIWNWMEMNRISTLREIKRVELAISDLAAKLPSKDQ